MKSIKYTPLDLVCRTLIVVFILNCCAMLMVDSWGAFFMDAIVNAEHGFRATIVAILGYLSVGFTAVGMCVKFSEVS